jgi:hypothetical protein
MSVLHKTFQASIMHDIPALVISVSDYKIYVPFLLLSIETVIILNKSIFRLELLVIQLFNHLEIVKLVITTYPWYHVCWPALILHMQ